MSARQFTFLLLVGIAWAPWLRLVPAITLPLGVKPTGETDIAVLTTAGLGEITNIAIASLLLALVLAFARIPGLRWVHVYVVVAPGFLWAMYDLGSRLLGMDGYTVITVVYFAALLVFPPLFVKGIDRVMTGKSSETQG